MMARIVIEVHALWKEGVDEGYCYTAIHFTTDGVLLAYCAGGAADKHRLAKLRIKKLPFADFK